MSCPYLLCGQATKIATSGLVVGLFASVILSVLELFLSPKYRCTVLVPVAFFFVSLWRGQDGSVGRAPDL